MKRKIKLLPIVLLSLACVSATIVGVDGYINGIQDQQQNARNPVLMLDANDPDGEATFASGDSKISKIVKNGTTWEAFSKNMPSPTKSGFDIRGWEYSNDGINFSDVYDSLTFTHDTYLRVKEWGAATKDTFSTDSWATIVSYASQGLEVLKDAYYADISRFGGTFVIQDYSNEEEVKAKTRTVYLKGMGEYKVHVIGEGEDQIAGETNKVATLTFEFDDIVVPSIGFSMGDDNNNWEDSYVRYFLQNSFIHRLPDPINRSDILQKVVKKTYNQATDKVEDITDNLFIPSLSELGYNYMNEDSLYIDGGLYGVRNGSDNIACRLEGSPYSFYLNENNNASRIKKYGERDETLSYWTRSPFTVDVDDPINDTSTHKGVHIIDESGAVPGMANGIQTGYSKEGIQPSKVRANNSVNGISPCFCIGQSTAYNLTVNVADGSNIIAKHTNFIANNLDARIQLLDERDYSAPVIHYNTGLLDTETYKEIHVKVNGETIPTADLQYTNYTYDRKTGLLNINIDMDYKEITGDVVVTIDKPTKTKFETDSWTAFFNNADRGYENLTSIYADAYIANGDTFLGLKREVEIHYSDDYHPTILARVIGEQHDETVDGKKTALTFQFTQGYKFDYINGTGFKDGDKQVEYIFKYQPYDRLAYAGRSEWDDMYVLDNFVDNAARILDTTAIEDLLESHAFTDHVKEVKKSAVQYDNSAFTMLDFNAQLFLPSYEELVGRNSLSFEGEGTQYEYYVGAGDYAHRFLSSPSSKTNVDTSTAARNRDYCWTRSISTLTRDRKLHTMQGLVIAINGSLGTADSVDCFSKVASIIPCFAVGFAEAQ